MRFQFGLKKKSNTHALEVRCAHCEKPVLIYQKGGNGGLIKVQFHRIIEAEFNPKNHRGAMTCPFCGAMLGKCGQYFDHPTYWILRGQVRTKRLSSYQYPKKTL